MKTKDIQKLKNKSAEELKKEVAEKKEKLWELKKDVVSGKLKNVRAPREAAKEIARMLTLIKEKEAKK